MKQYGLYVGHSTYECLGQEIVPQSPIDGSQLTSIMSCTPADIQSAIVSAKTAFNLWRQIPAPHRGELIRQLGNVFRERKSGLASLITLEVGKTITEALGEVQEVIDICDFATGLSRQLYGLTIASERPKHRLTEQWHPLGIVGIITAFNFPMAVWAWNAALALVCGNAIVWKPSEKTPLCSIACHMAFVEATKRVDFPIDPSIATLAIGYADVGEEIANNVNFNLVSATGSTKMGKNVASRVAQRLGRSLLELGGNAAMIVAPTADLNLALNAAVFSAVGTSGQRCTTLRRLIVHKSIYDHFKEKLKLAYLSLIVGDPRHNDVHLGPLIDLNAVANFNQAKKQALSEGSLVCEAINDIAGCYVNPVVIEFNEHKHIMNDEVFGPLLYMIPYSTLEQAIYLNNNVPQGLSSTIMTNDMHEAEMFCSAVGSDCGLANVNIGTSGAEIGGAFGGEKDTGGGRESGSDAWKNYMRRQTNTINYSKQLPLAQGVVFNLQHIKSRSSSMGADGGSRTHKP